MTYESFKSLTDRFDSVLDEKYDNSNRELLKSRLNEYISISALLRRNINYIAEEKCKLEEAENVKKYVLVESQKRLLDSYDKNISNRINMIMQDLCDHEIIYLTKFKTKQLKYNPNFKCLSCGKNIFGIIDDDQVCINEEYTLFDEEKKEYLGSETEYQQLKQENDKMISESIPVENRVEFLSHVLERKHKNNSNKLKLIRIEKDDCK